MGVQIPYRLTRIVGDCFGHYYNFQQAGDGLQMHRHSYEHEHNVIVLVGSVRIYGEDGPNDGWCKVLQAGDVYDIDSDIVHEVQALEDNTLTLNLYLHGFPREYLLIADKEFSGATRPPLYTLEGVKKQAGTPTEV
jgi:hypothetical protein